MATERLTLQLRTLPRDPFFPTGDDEALGESMWAELTRRLGGGPVRPTAILLGEEAGWVVDLQPLLAPPPVLHRRLAALAGLPGSDALAVLGVLWRRARGRAPERYAVVFVEWSDGRWWLAQHRIVDAPTDDGAPGRVFGLDLAGERQVLRAVRGDARPGGLGGWFSRARFEGLRAVLGPSGSSLEN